LLSETDTVLLELESHATAATSRSPAAVVSGPAESEDTLASDEAAAAWRKEAVAGPPAGWTVTVVLAEAEPLAFWAVKV
jgi:hypothetical protein